MRVDACISSGASQVFALSEWNVFTIRVLVALGETEIDDENVVFVSVVSSNQKVIWFDVSVDDSLFMDLLNTLNLFQMINWKLEYHLNSNAQDSLEVKLSSALLEKIFKTFAEEIHHHHVIGLIVFSLFITNEVKVRDAC